MLDWDWDVLVLEVVMVAKSMTKQVSVLRRLRGEIDSNPYTAY